MKRTLLLAIILATTCNAFSQNTQSGKFDFQQVPQSPAFTLLGVQPSLIDKPTSTTDFAASLINATSSFTVFPTSYALEFNPYHLLVKDSKEKYSPLFIYKNNAVDRTERINNSLANGSLLSIGVVTEKFSADILRPKIAIGAKICLASGHTLSNETIKQINEKFKTYGLNWNKSNLDLLNSDSDYKKANDEQIKLRLKIELGYDIDTLTFYNDLKARIVDSIKRINMELTDIEKQITSYSSLLGKNATASEKLILAITLQPLKGRQNALTEKLSILNSDTSNLNYKTTQIITRKYNDLEITALRSMLEKDSLHVLKMYEEKAALIDKKADVADAFTELKAISVKRVGFKCDLAGGFIMSYPTLMHDSIQLSGYGIWTVLGYEWEKAGCFFAIRGTSNIYDTTRSSNQDYHFRYRTTGSIEIGGRVFYDAIDKLEVSAEILYRATFGATETPVNRWRFMANLSYDLGNNKVINFNIGKDYNSNTPNLGGNLVAGLNLMLGFGSTRQVNSGAIQKEQLF